jgi:hypothetical protein
MESDPDILAAAPTHLGAPKLASLLEDELELGRQHAGVRYAQARPAGGYVAHGAFDGTPIDDNPSRDQGSFAIVRAVPHEKNVAPTS